MQSFDPEKCECEICECPPSRKDEHEVCELCGGSGHTTVCNYCWYRDSEARNDVDYTRN